MNKKIAIVPGSFDPITYGHIDIVKRASTMYDTVYLAVMINDRKQYLFDIEDSGKTPNLFCCSKRCLWCKF